MSFAEVSGTELVENPYPLYARLRREEPVWRLPTEEAFLVTTWQLVSEATARFEDFSNRFRHTIYRAPDDGIGVMALDAGTAVLAGADPPDHTEHRRLFFPELVQRKIAALEGAVAAIVDDHLDALLAAGGGDAAEALADPVPLRVVVEYVMGMELHDPALTRSWVFAGARLMGGRLGLDELGAAAVEAAGILPWVTEQLDGAIDGDRTSDVLGAAAAGVRSGVLTRDEAAFALMVLVGAGSETTSSLIGNTIRVLAERPSLQEELRHEPARIPALIEEVLRLESPFRFHPRSAARDTELGGVAIPAGALVALCWASANRDDAVFERPDELLLDRPNPGMHLAFGRGIHHCVGAPLARLEARVAVGKLLAQTSAFALRDDDPPRRVDSLWVHRHERLPIVLQPARPTRSGRR